MKYSTLFTIISLILIIIPWTGIPFGFIRIVITILALLVLLFSVGLYQKEQKISAWIQDVKNSQQEAVHEDEKQALKETVISDLHTHDNNVIERKKLSEIL